MMRTFGLLALVGVITMPSVALAQRGGSSSAPSNFSSVIGHPPPLTSSDISDFGAAWSTQMAAHPVTPGGIGAPTLNATGQVPMSQSYSTLTKQRVICQNVLFGYFEGTYATSTYSGETNRLACTLNGPISEISLFVLGKTASGGLEVAASNPVFHQIALEYPANFSQNFDVNGQVLFPVDPTTTGVYTHVLGAQMDAGTTFYLRVGTFVATPPPSIATPVAAAGGALAASTVYFYKATCVTQGVESGPTAEVTASTTASNLTLGVTWGAATSLTTNPAGCSNVKVYRSTATGAETYLATVPSPGLTYVDTGAAAPVAGAVPPAAQVYPVSDYNLTGNTSNSIKCGGAGGNQVVGTGALAQVGGSSGCTVANTVVVLADDEAAYPVCGLGDSIQSGTGYPNAYANAGLPATRQNWFMAALGGSAPVLNLSTPSSQVGFLTNSTSSYGGNVRLGLLRHCARIVSNQGTNDYATGTLGLTIAANQLRLARIAYNNGQKYYVTTLLPRGSITANGITAASFTPLSSDGERVNYNNWIYNGLQVNGSGAPVLSGGTRTPYVAGFIDLAASLPESNSSGVATQNGSFWPFPASPSFTGTFTGTPTTQSMPVASGAFTASLEANDVIKITSGAASGQTCQISTNTATTLTCPAGGLTTAPASGDGFQIWVTPTQEGIHPNPSMQANMRGAFSAVITGWTPF